MKAAERELRQRIARLQEATGYLQTVVAGLQAANASLAQELAVAESRISAGVTKQLLLMERLIEADEKIQQLTQSKKVTR